MKFTIWFWTMPPYYSDLSLANSRFQTRSWFWDSNILNSPFSSGGLGGGGNIDTPICVLPLNMMNQKYFSFLFVWLAILLILTVGILTARVVMIALRDFRTMELNVLYGIKVKKVKIIHFFLSLNSFFHLIMNSWTNAWTDGQVSLLKY